MPPRLRGGGLALAAALLAAAVAVASGAHIGLRASRYMPGYTVEPEIVGEDEPAPAPKIPDQEQEAQAAQRREFEKLMAQAEELQARNNFLVDNVASYAHKADDVLRSYDLLSGERAQVLDKYNAVEAELKASHACHTPRAQPHHTRTHTSPPLSLPRSIARSLALSLRSRSFTIFPRGLPLSRPLTDPDTPSTSAPSRPTRPPT